MGLYHLNLDELSEYTGISISELKTKSYADLESMIKTMENDKIMERNNRNAQDDEYERLVLKYFKPVSLLRHWFEDKEIVLACARTGVTESNLCSEMFISPGGKCRYDNGEFIRTSVEYVPQYDKMGRELMERVSKRVDVYRVANQYQGLHHGDVILYLLYQRYPELAKFGFSAYSMGNECNYEIYPANNIYTSFTALMSGDVDAIIYRNREYCKWYNNGRYSPKECEKAFKTDEAMEMFDLIRHIGEQERAAGHFPVTTDNKGNLRTSDGLVETKISKSGNMKLLMEEGRHASDISMKRRFRLKCAALYTLERLVKEYLKMTDQSVVNIHIYHITDYIGQYGVNLKIDRNEYIAVDSGPEYEGDRFKCYDYIVCSTFGWIQNGMSDLTIRIDCPEINK